MRDTGRRAPRPQLTNGDGSQVVDGLDATDAARLGGSREHERRIGVQFICQRVVGALDVMQSTLTELRPLVEPMHLGRAQEIPVPLGASGRATLQDPSAVNKSLKYGGSVSYGLGSVSFVR